MGRFRSKCGERLRSCDVIIAGVGVCVTLFDSSGIEKMLNLSKKMHECRMRNQVQIVPLNIVKTHAEISRRSAAW